MSEYRVMLEGGDVLVVKLIIEKGADTLESVDPTGFGEALLQALGRARIKGKPARAIAPAVPEEDADDWLSRTSRDALRNL